VPIKVAFTLFIVYEVHILIRSGKICTVFFCAEGVAILSNAPEKLPEKKRPEKGERDRSRGHGSGGTNLVSHSGSRQVSYETFTFLYFIIIMQIQNLSSQVMLCKK
jgi:hypothetical protein